MYLSTIVSMYVLYDTQNNIHLKKNRIHMQEIKHDKWQKLKACTVLLYIISLVSKD